MHFEVFLQVLHDLVWKKSIKRFPHKSCKASLSIINTC